MCFWRHFRQQWLNQRAEFFEKGTGPLTQLKDQLVLKGLEEEQAANRPRTMLMAAQGMLVVLLVDDQGLVPIQQLFFGSLEEAFCKHAVELSW